MVKNVFKSNKFSEPYDLQKISEKLYIYPEQLIRAISCLPPSLLQELLNPGFCLSPKVRVTFVEMGIIICVIALSTFHLMFY